MNERHRNEANSGRYNAGIGRARSWVSGRGAGGGIQNSSDAPQQVARRRETPARGSFRTTGLNFVRSSALLRDESCMSMDALVAATTNESEHRDPFSSSGLNNFHHHHNDSSWHQRPQHRRGDELHPHALRGHGRRERTKRHKANRLFPAPTTTRKMDTVSECVARLASLVCHAGSRRKSAVEQCLKGIWSIAEKHPDWSESELDDMSDSTKLNFHRTLRKVLYHFPGSTSNATIIELCVSLLCKSFADPSNENIRSILNVLRANHLHKSPKIAESALMMIDSWVDDFFQGEDTNKVQFFFFEGGFELLIFTFKYFYQTDPSFIMQVKDLIDRLMQMGEIYTEKPVFELACFRRREFNKEFHSFLFGYDDSPVDQFDDDPMDEQDFYDSDHSPQSFLPHTQQPVVSSTANLLDQECQELLASSPIKAETEGLAPSPVRVSASSQPTTTTIVANYYGEPTREPLISPKPGSFYNDNAHDLLRDRIVVDGTPLAMPPLQAACSMGSKQSSGSTSINSTNVPVTAI